MVAVTFVRQGQFMILQFNTSCDDALPACQALCCRMRKFYNVKITPEEGPNYLTQEWNGGLVLQATPEGDCIYLHDNRCSIYAARPDGCRTWHCSPQGGMDDPEITDRANGWVLMPAKEVE